MKRTCVAFLWVCFTLQLTGCSRELNERTASHAPRSWVINADVPGTEIFLQGQRLGAVPFTLTREFFTSLGLELPQGDLDSDGWGGGIRLGELDENEIELSFRVPDAVAARYRAIETPWGRRTGTGGWLGGVALMDPVAEKGLDVSISVPKVHRDPNQPVRALLRAKNVSAQELVGSEPFVFLLYGTYQTPWRQRNMLEVDLPEAWCRFAPSEQREAELEFEPPNVSESFSVLAVLYLNEPKGPHTGKLTVYSNVEMLRTRYPNCPRRAAGKVAERD